MSYLGYLDKVACMVNAERQKARYVPINSPPEHWCTVCGCYLGYLAAYEPCSACEQYEAYRQRRETTAAGGVGSSPPIRFYCGSCAAPFISLGELLAHWAVVHTALGSQEEPRYTLAEEREA